MAWNAAVCHKLGCAENLQDIKRNCITYVNLKVMILRLCPTATSDTQNISWSWEWTDYSDTKKVCTV